jgi:prophage regulatory protein
MRYLRQPDVIRRTGVSWITILRWEKKGLFPKRCKLGPRIVGWVEAEVDDWCAKRAEGR